MAAKHQTKIIKARFMYSGYTPQEMIPRGEYMIKLNLARWDRGIDANDGPAPALKPRYAAIKGRRFGRRIRDWRATGRLRRGLKALTASMNRVTIGPTEAIHTQSRKRRSLTNSDVLSILNRQWRMWGASPNDKQEWANDLIRYRPIIQAKHVA